MVVLGTPEAFSFPSSTSAPHRASVTFVETFVGAGRIPQGARDKEHDKGDDKGVADGCPASLLLGCRRTGSSRLIHELEQRLGAGADVKLLVNVLQVHFHGLIRDVQAVGDFLV
jgi:hypothetical protein